MVVNCYIFMNCDDSLTWPFFYSDGQAGELILTADTSGRCRWRGGELSKQTTRGEVKNANKTSACAYDNPTAVNL